ncbi:M20/M25/M40 family metallo-hydrolase [Myroides sp. NP-2]|uniref:M28 family metallopeptidase n=1 Tax=Myroides sp. NP-2 TaxID=2759945 RepID=UPI0015F7FDE1|nr:M20/M25/M40 family metallo-hydrolase [Myroides sp. NP-2]MBB1149993.1 M20/M25/M40 family metallo-hydrolase [Myroides sp. NP-2]
MLKVKYISFLGAIFLASCTATTTISEQRKEEVSATNISTTLNYLASDELLGRDSGKEGNIKAATYLTKELKAYGIEPYFERYEDELTKVANTWNVVGVIPGKDPQLKNEIVVLGAHYDHIGIQTAIAGDSIANGANDNASGVSILLELARNLSQKDMKRTVLVCFFTAEEVGLLGSEHLANRLKSEEANVVLMLNFEMLGVPMTREYTTFITGYDQSNLAAKINEIAGENLAGRFEEAEKMQLFKRSDNYPFYLAYKIPSQTFSSSDFENFKYYHHVKDEAHLMDIPFMTELTAKFVPVVEKLINLPSGEIRLKN